MSTILPIAQTAKLVNESGNYTPEFKRYLDDLLRRVGGITGGTYNQLTDGTSILWDLDLYPVAFVTLGGNRTLSNPTNMVSGLMYRLTVIQDATGSRTLTWGSVYKFAGGTAPTLTTAANAVDEFLFSTDGTNMKLIAGALDLR